MAHKLETPFSKYMSHQIYKTPNQEQRRNIALACHSLLAQKHEATNLTSRQISEVVKGVVFDFKDLESVYIFIMCVFADYCHDLKNIGLVAEKLVRENPSIKNSVMTGKTTKTGKTSVTYNNLNIFRAYVSTIKWLDSNTKSMVLPMIDKSPLTRILIRAFGKTGTAKSINEALFMKNLFGYMLEKKGPLKELPFGVLKTTDVKDSLGSAKSHIAFDQTSKASAPQVYASYEQGHSFDIGLPMLADKGLYQPSNPVGSFMKVLKNYTENPVRGAANIKDYMVNMSRSFTVKFRFNGTTFLGFKYSYSDDGSSIDVHIDNANIDSHILSASDIQADNVSVSAGILKTCADIGIIAYGIASNSISITGDRAAGTTNMLFVFLQKRGRLSMTPVAARVKTQLFSRFIFEVTPRLVLVPTTIPWLKFRTRDASNLTKTNGERYNEIRRNFTRYYTTNLNSEIDEINSKSNKNNNNSVGFSTPNNVINMTILRTPPSRGASRAPSPMSVNASPVTIANIKKREKELRNLKKRPISGSPVERTLPIAKRTKLNIPVANTFERINSLIGTIRKNTAALTKTLKSARKTISKR